MNSASCDDLIHDESKGKDVYPLIVLASILLQHLWCRERPTATNAHTLKDGIAGIRESRQLDVDRVIERERVNENVGKAHISMNNVEGVHHLKSTS